MLPYVDISLADSVKVTKTVGNGDNQTQKIEMTMRVVKAVNVCFINPQMYRRFITEKIKVWVQPTSSNEFLADLEEQDLVPEINEIIALTAIQPPWQEKFEPIDTIYMTNAQLFALVEMLNPDFVTQEQTQEAEISEG